MSIKKRKLIADISSSAVQMLITQLIGLVIFYLISKYISKDDFGAYNWCTAVGATIIAIASLGLDSVLIKRIASGRDVKIMTGIHFFHTLVSALVLCCSLLLIQTLFPTLFEYHPLFFLVFLNLAILNIANSFKLSLNGLEAYKKLAVISVWINLLKLITVIVLFVGGFFTIRFIVIGFIICSFVEFILSYYFFNTLISSSIKPLFIAVEYKSIVYESLPQLGVVLFDSALARIDWILLGIFSTATITAEYSFAYRFFELSRLPMLIIAPILLTRFSKLYINEQLIADNKKQEIQRFFRIELFIAFIIPLLMVCIWTDFVDYFTNNKYGAVNLTTYRILAICVPLHYLINFLWTMGFVQGQLKLIMYITIATSLLNVLLNLLLIPHYGSIGAASSFLGCSIVQAGLYFMLIHQKQLRIKLMPFFILFSCALISIIVAKLVLGSTIFVAISALGLYFLLSFILKQISFSDLISLTRK
jgi:O-antigen/teichoic acid export membrane protein